MTKKKCPPINCKPKTPCLPLRTVVIPAVLGDDSADSPVAPQNGAYHNALVEYAANGAIYIYSSDGIFTKLSSKINREDLATTEYVDAADNNLQEQIDALAASSDVVDVVGTYAELQNYDTSKLKANDIVKVLTDESKDGATTYYRWNNGWTYIGSEGTHYTKAEADSLFVPQTRTVNGKALNTNIALTAGDVGAASSTALSEEVSARQGADNDLQTQINGKQDTLTAGANITIENNVISALGGGTEVALYNTTGQNTDGAMTQKATTDALNLKADASSLATVATTGDYGDLLNAPTPYTLPIAGANTLGGIKVGTGLSIDNAGILSVTGGGGGDIVLYNTTGQNTDGAMTQKATTDALDLKANTSDLAAVATSGSYTDLSDKPTIGDATITVQKNGVMVDSFTANTTTNKTINLIIPTTASDVSALPASTKYGASITMSIDNSTYKVTTTLKDQDGNALGAPQEIDLPLETMVVSGSYDDTNKKIVLTLQNGNTIDVPVGALVSGLQSEITSTNMLDADLVDDSTSVHKFVTSADLTKLSGIQAGAEVNVQSNWNETDTSADSYIQNKPNLATVATTGAYSDLTGTPTLATVATTGDYTDLLNTPTPYTLPAATANDLGGIKVGTGLAIDQDGVLSATGTSLPLYTTIGENTDGPMTQKAVRAALFADSVRNNVRIGNTNTSADGSVGIGYNATGGTRGVAIGSGATSKGNGTIAIGYRATTGNNAYASVLIGQEASAGNGSVFSTTLGYGATTAGSIYYSVALGSHSVATRTGEVNVGTGSNNYGYNSTAYRVIGGVHDGVDNHDAATVGQLNTAIASAVSPITDAEIDAICV